jgi:twitching motility protein PilT
MTLTTIHANSPVEALMSLSKFAEVATGEAIARQMLASALKGVLHQTLRNNQLHTDYLSVTGKDAFSIKHKIRIGKFEQIDEDLNLQKTQRANGRPI